MLGKEVFDTPSLPSWLTDNTIQLIWEKYNDSVSQQQAYDTYITDILKGNLLWHRTTDSKTNTTKPDKQLFVQPQWVLFIREFILHLCLFGYVVYRYHPPKNKAYDKQAPFYEFAPPEAHTLVKDSQNQWRIQHTATFAGRALKQTRLWHLSILSPPRQQYTGDNMTPRMVPTSFGYRSLNSVTELQRLQETIHTRDTYNSYPHVYTQMSKVLNTSTPGKHTFFPSPIGHLNLDVDPNAEEDFSSKLQNRIETIQGLETIDAMQRAKTHTQYADQTNPLPIGNRNNKRKMEDKYVQMKLPDGRDAVITPFLRAPENLNDFIQKYNTEIMYIWGVPPQVTGQTITKERNPASGQISQKAMDDFAAHSNHILSLLQPALRNLSMFFSKSSDLYLKITPAIDAHTLSQVESILKPEEAAQMYASVYNIPPDKFDLSAIRTRQQALLGTLETKPPANQSDSLSVGQKKTRTSMTETQKQQREAVKAKKPSDSEK